MTDRPSRYPALWRTATEYPAIDNHAHQLLKAENRDDIPLLLDSTETLASYRNAKQLADLYGLSENASWEEIKTKRAEMDYFELCKLCFRSMNIRTILIDDGLKFRSITYDIPWHNQLTQNQTRCKRIVRIETVAEEFLDEMVQLRVTAAANEINWDLTEVFWADLEEYLSVLARREDVVAFKLAICYRTGLTASPAVSKPAINAEVYPHLIDEKGNVRFKYWEHSDYLVHIGLRVAQAANIPVQFHTGLGDGDLSLALASPAHLQPLIKQYPGVTFILIHSSYPYSRDSGYLSSIHPNVYLDFSEAFPIVARRGQRSVIRQLLEIAPTNKVMWSTDAYFWPERYYLGSKQSRTALFDVLGEIVDAGELAEGQACRILENILFHNANRLYNLKLTP